jgi:hypothetical protein
MISILARFTAPVYHGAPDSARERYCNRATSCVVFVSSLHKSALIRVAGVHASPRNKRGAFRDRDSAKNGTFHLAAVRGCAISPFPQLRFHRDLDTSLDADTQR